MWKSLKEDVASIAKDITNIVRDIKALVITLCLEIILIGLYKQPKA